MHNRIGDGSKNNQDLSQSVFQSCNYCEFLSGGRIHGHELLRLQVGNQTDFIARKISIYNLNIVLGMEEMSEIGLDFLVLNHQYRYVF